MSVELTMLAYSVALLFVIILIQGNATILSNGVPYAAGNRDEAAPQTAFQGRVRRTVMNHVEGLAMFAPLALIAAQQGVSTPMTVLAAQLFFYGRVAHAALYLAGVPMLRTLAWLASIAGTVMMFLAIFKIA